MSADSTKQWLAEVKARCEAATPGPWLVGKKAGLPGFNLYQESGADVTSPGASLSAEDASLVAHAREDVPRLLTLVERLSEYAAHAYDCAVFGGFGRPKAPCDCGLAGVWELP